MKKLTLLLVVSLQGCAICQTHPAACGVVVGLAAGEVIYLTHRKENHPPLERRSIETPRCNEGTCE